MGPDAAIALVQSGRLAQSDAARGEGTTIMKVEEMTSLVSALAAAKSRRDVQAALDVLHPVENQAGNRDTLVCWGTARLTMTGDRFGVTPSGARAVLPVFIEFNFKDGLIARERFFYDLSELCAQSGVSTDAVRRTVFAGAP
jgi:hypothetical protein